MHRIFLFVLYLIHPYFVSAQQNTFNEVFQTTIITDITELPNGEFFFTTPRHGFAQHWGIRAYRLSETGATLDSLSIVKSDFQHYIGLYGHQLLLEEDSTVVSTWMAWDDSLGFRTYITKWQVFPNIDTLITKELDWKYPNTITNNLLKPFGLKMVILLRLVL